MIADITFYFLIFLTLLIKCGQRSVPSSLLSNYNNQHLLWSRAFNSISSWPLKIIVIYRSERPYTFWELALFICSGVDIDGIGFINQSRYLSCSLLTVFRVGRRVVYFSIWFVISPAAVILLASPRFVLWRVNLAGAEPIAVPSLLILVH